MNKIQKDNISIRRQPLPEISRPYLIPLVKHALAADSSGTDQFEDFEPPPTYSKSILAIKIPFNRLIENGTQKYLKNHNQLIEIKKNSSYFFFRIICSKEKKRI